MRVALLSTTDLAGGAARAAFRLLHGLRALDHDCSMLVRKKLSEDRDVCQVALDDGPLAKQREREAGRIRQYCIERNRTALSNTWFSLPIPGYDLARHERIQNADVVHLHWVSEFLSPLGIGKLQDLGKPLVWTLHDQRALTGGCHYSAGCLRYEKDCQRCPQLREADFALTATSLRESRECIGRNLVVVCPSRWMADCARRSALFKDTRIEVIPYGIDTDVFRPRRAAARTELGLDPTSIYLLAGADCGEEQRKGFGLLREAVRLSLALPAFRQAVTEKRVRFLFFGQTPPLAEMDLPAQALGRLDTEEGLAKVYAASDAFLLPSTEDNLPNTMLESICSGTPVIGFATGGLPDVIESGQNGLLVRAGDARELARAIQEFTENPELRRKLAGGCAAQAGSRFGLQEQARRHLHLYEDLRRSCPVTHRVESPTVVQPLAAFGKVFGSSYPLLLRHVRRERFKRHWPFLCRLFRLDKSS